MRGIGHHNPAQDIGAYFGITIDITDRKLVEQEREALSNALQQSNAYLAEAQSLTHVGSWACNLVTQQIFHSSDENARMYGFDPSQGPIHSSPFTGRFCRRMSKRSGQSSKVQLVQGRIMTSSFGFVVLMAPFDVCAASDTTVPLRKPVSTLVSRWTLQTKSVPRKNVKGCGN